VLTPPFHSSCRNGTGFDSRIDGPEDDDRFEAPRPAAASQRTYVTLAVFRIASAARVAPTRPRGLYKFQDSPVKAPPGGARLEQ